MKVFISHNRAQKPLAEQIGRSLLGQGLDVWLDKWEMYAGDSLIDGIESGLTEAHAVIVLLSPEAVASKWVREELRGAIHRRMDDPKFHIIPVIVEKCAIPLFLRDYKYIDWRSDPDAALVDLVVAIKRVRLKPGFTPDSRQAKRTFLDAVHSIRLVGVRAQTAIFAEHFSAIALRQFQQIDRQIDFSGEIRRVEGRSVEVKRRSTSPHQEKWTLVFPSAIDKDSRFSFSVEYEIESCFPEAEPIWAYAIEAPTEKLTVDFDFRETEQPAWFKVFHRVGQSLYEEPVGVLNQSRRFVWEKLVPIYKDAYEFHFSWPDAGAT